MAVTLIVQDDYGQTANANAYITTDYYIAYVANQNVDASGYDINVLGACIIAATTYMDTRWRYNGIRANYYQTTEWPRYNIFDVDNVPVFGIVDHVQRACAEYTTIAYAAYQAGSSLNPIPTRDSSGARVQSRTTQVGPIMENIRFVPGAIFVQPVYPIADGLLVKRGYTIPSSRLMRG